MKKQWVAFFLIITVSLLLTGCTSKLRLPAVINLPEAEKIQGLLNEQSEALTSGSADKFGQTFSDACPQKPEEIANFKEALREIAYKKYSQTLKSAQRMQDCVICSVEIRYEAIVNEREITKNELREMAFIFESGSWKIIDSSFHPYVNPTVIVGSDSLLQDAAASMSTALSSKLYTDKMHLQTYGDIILIGSVYDNASILDLEARDLTQIKVTEDYPGSEIGVVQVLTGIENYRHTLIMQSSGIATAEKTVQFMVQHLKKNPYMVPGVYFYEGDKLRKPSFLEMTTLTTLDTDKTEERIEEVRHFIEANIALLQNEIETEREALKKSTGKHTNPMREDFHEAFSRYENTTLPHSLGMILINAALSDRALCTKAFELPEGSSPGTLYASAIAGAQTFVFEPEKNSFLSYAQNSAHRLAAHEMQSFKAYPGKPLGSAKDLAAYNTALLRLAGFSEEEVFSVINPDSASNYCDTDGGYAVDPTGNAPYHGEKLLAAEEILTIENEGSYINFKNTGSNLDADRIQEMMRKINTLYQLKRKLTEDRASQFAVKAQELTEPVYLPYSTRDIYDLLRDTFITWNLPNQYASLSEAKENLRSVMGELLSLKCSSFLKNTASLYPGSQFDYARYAAGFMNVAYPEAYAQAAEKSRLIDRLYGGIGGILDSEDQRLEKLLKILSEISDSSKQDERLLFPDFCLWNRIGTPSDKALAAYGIYKKLLGSNSDAYVAIGQNSAYLAFKKGEQWFFIDCKDNQVLDYLSDTVILAFDSRQSYRPEEDEEKPEFFK